MTSFEGRNYISEESSSHRASKETNTKKEPRSRTVEKA